MKRALVSVCGVICLLLLWGCVPTSRLYVGKMVDDADILALKHGQQKDITWETFDVVMNFDYEVRGDSLLVAGKGRLGDHYQAMYTHLRHFYVYFFQVDGDGYVLETSRLPTLMMNRPDDVFTFEKIAKLLPETTGISFGYSGDVYERERGEPFFMPFFNTMSFRKLPILLKPR